MKKTKVWIRALLAGILLVAALGIGVYRWDSTRMGEMASFDTEVVVTDGTASPEMESRSLSVSGDGSYVFQLNCSTDKEGLITGVKIYDTNRELLVTVTGEQFSMESAGMELAQGDYTVEFWYLGSLQSWRDFLESAGETFSPVDADGNPDETYAFAESGTWRLHLEYGRREALPSYVSGMLGLALGILGGILMVVAITWLIRKMGGKIDVGLRCNKDNYDERQTAVRGRAYRISYFTLMCYLAVASILDEVFGIPLLMSMGGMWIGLCLSVFVFASICIWQDAYMSLYENAKGIILTFLALEILYLILNVHLIHDSGLVQENGKLSNASVNVSVSTLLFAVLLVFILRLLYNKQHTDREDEAEDEE